MHHGLDGIMPVEDEFGPVYSQCVFRVGVHTPVCAHQQAYLVQALPDVLWQTLHQYVAMPHLLRLLSMV